MVEVALTEKRIIDGREEQEVLVLKVVHCNGLYRFSCNKETNRIEMGYTCCEFIPLAKGNFNYTVTTGRKSQKKLNILNNILETHKEKLTELWKTEKYQDMCRLVSDIAVLEKVA